MTGVLFDASRLVFRLARGRALTGIDRVALAYARWLQARTDVELEPVWCFEGRLLPVAPGLLRWMVEAKPREAAGAATTWSSLVTALASAADDGQALRAGAGGRTDRGWLMEGLRLAWPVPLRAGLSAGDLYLNVSHYGVGQGGLLARLRRRGVKPVVMVHDLIPILHPEFCTPGGALKHALRMEAVLAHAALVIANSASTAEAVAAFALDEGRAPPPLCVAPLGLEPAFLAAPEDVRAARPYFVCVGTLEPRKNLAFLLTLWSRLAERMGEEAPRLVLVGRRGWENEAVIDLLERAPAVRRLVHEVCDLTDGQLASLMAGAAALLAPSFAEGFDLPAAEALALGAPVIASDIPVHRELAGGAELIDPLDGPGWLAAIETAAREAPWAQAPRPSRTAPTWERHFAIVGEALGLERVRPPGFDQRSARG
jgi:glycosyltransferase involved in cell wall biosynthesis